MITITSFLHRDRLKDLIARWMIHYARSTDAADLRRLVFFNNVFVSRYLGLFGHRLFSALHDDPVICRPARRKADLKDVIIQGVPRRSARTDTLIRNYLRHPGRYFRETPFQGTLFFAARGSQRRYVGSTRIKRVRRLAEKCARRIIDGMFESVAAARGAGVVPRAAARAERTLLEQLRSGKPVRTRMTLAIHDVAGVKVILEDDQHDRLLSYLAAARDCEIVEQEPHRGRYNAVNLVVRFFPSREHILRRPLDRAVIRLLNRHGMTPAEADRQFTDFVRSGEPEIQLEVIISSYAEMLESEIGRAMHEEMIMLQRTNGHYRSQLARNIEFLLEYLFAFPASDRDHLGELPLRLWDRYLPDYFDEVLRSLHGLPSLGAPGTFHVPPACCGDTRPAGS